MLWPALHPCQAKTRGKAGGEGLAGAERPGAAGALSPPHPARTRLPHAAPRAAPAARLQPAGPGPGLTATLGAAGSPCASGEPGLRFSCTRSWLELLPLSSQIPVVLHEHLMINSIVIQLLLPAPKYIAQSKLSEIH